MIVFWVKKVVSVLFKEGKGGLNAEVVIDLSKRLLEIFGERLIAVTTIEGFDGSNVRVVLRGKTFDDVRRVMDVVGEIEEKYDMHGKILPEVVGEDYVEIISEES